MVDTEEFKLYLVQFLIYTHPVVHKDGSVGRKSDHAFSIFVGWNVRVDFDSLSTARLDRFVRFHFLIVYVVVADFEANLDIVKEVVLLSTRRTNQARFLFLELLTMLPSNDDQVLFFFAKSATRDVRFLEI